MRPEDERAFTDYVGARTTSLLRYAYLLTGHPASARDLVQRALAKACMDWQHAERDGADTYVKTSILRDQLSLRRRVLQRERAADPPDDDPLWRALVTLSPRQRAILVLRYHEDLSDGEIADALGVTPGSVRSQAAKALDIVRHHLHVDHVPAVGETR